MNTTANTTLDATSPLQREAAESDRVTAVLLDTVAAEPHARVIVAMATALSLLAEAYPCCRVSLGKVLMQMGLRMQTAPDASNGHHVH